MTTLHTERSSIRATDTVARTVELVNVQRLSRRSDGLPTFADVLRRHGEQLEPPIPADELERVAAVLRELGSVFQLTDVDEAAAAVNELLERYCAPPRLMRHDGWPWHLHVDGGDDEPWQRWMGASGAFALASSLPALAAA